MKITINIDLRKADPLGPDLDMVHRRVVDCYHMAKQMGPGDSSKAGWYQHNSEYQRLLREARYLHSMLLTIAKLVGPEATEKIPALSWAIKVDFYGNARTEANTFRFDQD